MNKLNDFVEAYTWLYGGSKKKAESIYRRAMEIADYSYIDEVIDCYDGNKEED